MNEKLSNFAFNKGKNYIKLTQNEKVAEKLYRQDNQEFKKSAKTWN